MSAQTDRKPIVNSILYFATETLRKGVSVLMIPVYTAFLTTAEYGVLGVVSSLGVLLSVFFSLSLDATVVRFYYDKDADAGYHRRLYGTLVTSFLVIDVAAFLLFAATARWTLAPLLGNVGVFPFGILALALLATEPLFRVHQRILKASQDGLRFSINNVTRFLLVTGSTLVALIVLRAGVEGVLWARVLVSGAFFAYSLAVLARRFGVTFHRRTFRDCIAYSAPLIPNRTSGMVSLALGNLLVNVMHSPSSAGLLQLASQLGAGFLLLFQSVHEALLPWYYDQLENHGQRGRARVVRASQMTLTIFCYLCVVASLISKELFGILAGDDFILAWVAFPFVASTASFHMVKNIWLVPLLFNKSATRYAPIATYSNLGLSLALSILLIPRFDYVGSAIATLIARALSSVVMMWFSRRHEDIGQPAFATFIAPTLALLVSLLALLELALSVRIAIIVLAGALTWMLTRHDLATVVKIVLRRTPSKSAAATSPEGEG